MTGASRPGRSPRRSRGRAAKVSKKGGRPSARRRQPRAPVPKRTPAPKATVALVSTEWLADHLDGVRVVDGTWHMPQLQRDPRREFEEGHIPG